MLNYDRRITGMGWTGAERCAILIKKETDADTERSRADG